MTDGISINLKGGDALLRKMRALGVSGLRAGARSLQESAENIMTISKRDFVPVETGTLRSSGIVQLPEISRDSVSVKLGYGGPAAPYAIYVHENPRAGKTGGVSPSGVIYKRYSKVGQWKYLETPVKRNSSNIVRKLKRDLDAAFKGL